MLHRSVLQILRGYAAALRFELEGKWGKPRELSGAVIGKAQLFRK